MKKLLLLSAFIIPALCKAQCPIYLDVPADSVTTVIHQIENIAAVTLTANHDRDDRIDYTDSSNSILVRILLNDDSKVKLLSIRGKAELTDKMYMTYFIPLSSACITKQTATFFYTDKYNIVCHSISGTQKEIYIEAKP